MPGGTWQLGPCDGLGAGVAALAPTAGTMAARQATSASARGSFKSVTGHVLP